jgi:hypothetical protein
MRPNFGKRLIEHRPLTPFFFRGKNHCKAEIRIDGALVIVVIHLGTATAQTQDTKEKRNCLTHSSKAMGQLLAWLHSLS